MNDPRLLSERNVWLATVRPSGQPHLIPIWFIWHAERFYLCTGKDSVKGRNLQANPQVALSLEDGNQPLIAEGIARLIDPPYDQALIDAFQQKYAWDMQHSDQYNILVEIVPRRWLTW